jgi:serine protease Do
MNERYDFYNYGNYGYKPPRKKNRIITYIALVLVASLVSSVAVGGILYGKFSRELDEVRLSALNTGAGAEQIAAEGASGITQDNTAAGDTTAAGASDSRLAAINTDSLVKAALTKGSDVTTIAKKVGPSIVGIRMTVGSTRQNNFGGSGNQTAEGSGIIISKDGYIMTNYHVVSYADPKSGSSSRTVLEVFLSDGRNAKATFKGGDDQTDLAVIKVDLKDLTPAELGDSSTLEVGELAVAIGNPLGMEFAGSVTVGVISALNRTVEMEDKTMNLIQTDAAINSGNSGGALLNSQGQVIGINSVKISATGVEGLGFAIPVNDAKPIVNQLMLYGYVKGRPYMGISGQEISDVMSRWYNIPVGVYITEVTAGSGADKAGIKAEDILVAMDGKTVETLNDLDKIMDKHKAGDTVTVTLYRNNAKMSVKMTFDEAK